MTCRDLVVHSVITAITIIIVFLPVVIQVCDFWKQLSWPELASSYPFVYSIVEVNPI